MNESSTANNKDHEPETIFELRETIYDFKKDDESQERIVVSDNRITFHKQKTVDYAVEFGKLDKMKSERDMKKPTKKGFQSLRTGIQDVPKSYKLIQNKNGIP